MEPKRHAFSIRKLPWSYGWFITWNWGISMAYKLWNDECYGLRKYGLFPAKQHSLHDLTAYETPNQDHTFFMPVSYRLLERILTALAPFRLRHIVDVGAGEGRALAIAAYHGMDKLTAIEVHPELAQRCREQLTTIQEEFPSIHTSVLPLRFQDVTLPTDADLIFLFNPFGEKSMDALIEQIDMQIPATQPVFIAYVNPIWLNCWTNNGYSLMQQDISDRYFQFAILKREPKTK